MHSAQAVVMGEKAYVGGGDTENRVDRFHIFQYITFKDKWSRLPPHYAIYFAMAQFVGSLITVGGGGEWGIGPIGKVYHFKEVSQEQEGFPKPMPTARWVLTVTTTQSALLQLEGLQAVRMYPVQVCSTTVQLSSSTMMVIGGEKFPFPSEMEYVTI